MRTNIYFYVGNPKILLCVWRVLRQETENQMLPVSREQFKQNNEIAFHSSVKLARPALLQTAFLLELQNCLNKEQYHCSWEALEGAHCLYFPKEGPKVLSVWGEIKQTSSSTLPEKLMSNQSFAAKKGLEQGLPHPKGWEWLLGLGGKGEEGFIPNLGSLDTWRKGSVESPVW